MQTGIYGQQLDLFQLFQPTNTIKCTKKFTFVDLFSGIGGFRIPLEELGGKCLGYSEINKEAIKVYQKNFIRGINAEEAYLGDITNLHQLPFEIDIIVGGVPCQPWSIAGKMQGLEDPRGQLWLDVFRIVQLNKPKAFIFENVKGLTEPRNRASLEYILNNLTSSDYVVKYQVLNSYDFGLPQDRDRVFIVGIRNDIANCWGFTFPQALNKRLKLYDLIPGIQQSNLLKKKFPPEVLFTDGKIPASRGRFQKIDELNDFFTFADIRDGHTTIHSWELIETDSREKLICQTILKNRRKKIYGEKDGNPLDFEILKSLIPSLEIEEINTLVDKKILRLVEDKGYEFVNSKISSGINGISKIFLPHADAIATLTATGTRDYVATISIECEEPEMYKQKFIQEIYKQNKYKPLTAQDYARLQGFPENFQIADNETTAKHQFGNAVSVPVVYHLANALLKIIL
ncbi:MULTISPECIES: DNA cytosine methyltransferase [Cyanophyceae]|uniref:DNA cytosine methyltransferase n=1 Tax=Cyanophyceae TaxID=3028117 RepID=UPI00232BCD81|nr:MULTISPECIES: DNA cytosine methyltransferase [Cyanophyceae]MDB9355046.1 DNA cytosine methyltransferase [Nodularia spumigena CS-587/03]MDB9339904.1 DNA cytosine methyltransferase [Nodularia spumigena CS-589/07]MDB9362816.1 DNA cytosine methyltransferase [Nodularia spumigena CS-588/02]MDB9364627.1 DNA cytosine methyltransferase [Nodularia spumigena CS-588/02A10]MDB9399076.1 DNA cytosine methyltransferase [Microcystis aeruginosa CS-567/02-A1]